MKYLLLSLIPLFFSKAAVFTANIISARNLSLDEFSALSTIYITSVMLATPIVSTFNHYTSTIGVNLRKMVKLALYASIMVGSLSVGYIYFFIGEQSNQDILVSAFLVCSIIVLSGALNATLLGSNNGHKANIANSFGVLFFVLLSLYLHEKSSNFFQYLFLYLSIPIASLLINFFLLKRDKSIVNNLFKIQEKGAFRQLLVITLLGAPVQFIVVAMMNQLDKTNIEIANFNIAYQWHILVVLLPTMLATVILKSIATGSVVAKRLYRKTSYFCAIILAMGTFGLSHLSGDIYGSQFAQLQSSIKWFAVAGVLSVIYHVELNQCIALKQFDIGIKLSFFNALLYVILSTIILPIIPSAISIAICMSLSYLCSLIFFNIYKRKNNAS